MVEADIFGCLPCTDLLSAEIAREGMIINKIHMRNGLKDAVVTPLDCVCEADYALAITCIQSQYCASKKVVGAHF